MLVVDITEGYKQVWGRSSKGVVRKYRCTDGKKKGRVVAKPTTCSTATDQRKSITLKKTRRAKGKVQSIRRSTRMKHPTSKRIKALNKPHRTRKTRR
jgi:hypothetical protein|tara:strand:- start:645 stop:935 length:291 start_codon:yes stop_codon:yes gene_type:complete